MYRGHILLAVTLFAGAALAGCAGGTDGATTTTPTGGSTTSTMTTSTTTTTLPTPPVNGTPDVTPEVARVVVLTTPDRLEAAGPADVCIRVEGSGNVKHVALHWDTVAHPESLAFADYKGGAVYPDGASTLSPAGYDLPGVFCFDLPVSSQTVYFRGHALASGVGVLSGEHAIRAGAASGIRFTTEVREVASAGTNVTVCWATSVTGALPHTAIHWDTVSHPDSTAFGDYKGGAIYPANSTAVDPAGYTGPGPFCTNVKMPETGAIFFRAHELVPGSLNAVSDEESIVVASPVSVVSAPTQAAHGDRIRLCWRAEGTETVGHTAIHWDVVGHANSTAFGDYKGGAIYPANATTASGPYALPGPFCTTLEMPDDELYFRGHLLIPGARNELSEEWHVEHKD